MALTKEDLAAIQEMVNESSRVVVEQALRQATTVKPVLAPPRDLVYLRTNQEYYSESTGKKYRKYNGTLLELPTEA